VHASVTAAVHHDDDNPVHYDDNDAVHHDDYVYAILSAR
jgi:hypothetical protein